MEQNIVDGLSVWRDEHRELADRMGELFKEEYELNHRRHELLIRARDTGMTNKQVAAILGVTTQRVTSMMAEANGYVVGAAHRFIREALAE